MLERLRNDPLRALILIEWIALIATFVLDIVTVTFHLSTSPSDPRSIAIYCLVFAVAALAIFNIPHGPNRRYVIVAIAVAAVGGLMVVPTTNSAALIMLLILGARLTFAFGLRGTVLSWALSVAGTFIGDLWTYIEKPTRTNLVDGVVSVLIWSLFFMLIYGLMGTIWLYARKLTKAATVAERARIALDLHDSLGHSLTTLNVHLQNAISLQDVDQAKTRLYLERAGNLANDVLDDVRETVTILYDDAPEQHSPISQLLAQLRDDFTAALSINLEWSVRLENEPQGRSAMAIYRILQEALTNIIRHAGASRAIVRISSNTNSVMLHVSDNGRGFNTDHQGGHGLLSIRNRVESLSGTIDISSNDGAGTQIDVVFPLGANT